MSRVSIADCGMANSVGILDSDRGDVDPLKDSVDDAGGLSADGLVVAVLPRQSAGLHHVHAKRQDGFLLANARRIGAARHRLDTKPVALRLSA